MKCFGCTKYTFLWLYAQYTFQLPVRFSVVVLSNQKVNSSDVLCYKYDSITVDSLDPPGPCPLQASYSYN